MTSLLDVNILIALADRHHDKHDVARRWLSEHARDGWASCALTENGLVRIISNPGCPNTTRSPAVAIELLAVLRQMQGHVFWSNSVSLRDERFFKVAQIVSHKQVTNI